MTLVLRIAFPIILSVSLAALGAATTHAIQVNCDLGESINSALAIDTTLSVTGDCVEDTVIIARDGTTITGRDASLRPLVAGSDAMIIQGANVRVSGLTIRPDLGTGIVAGGQNGEISDSSIQDCGDGMGAINVMESKDLRMWRSAAVEMVSIFKGILLLLLRM